MNKTRPRQGKNEERDVKKEKKNKQKNKEKTNVILKK